ncbi:hypothetical protein VTO73DRAFT_10501 [Trametes versicolor]
MKPMKTLKFKDWNRSFVPFETRLPTRWEHFRDSPMRYVVRQAYEAYATLSPRATKQPGFSWPSDTIIRIVCISDTHSLHHRLPALPPGDILIHAGDLTDRGRVSQTRKALSWLNSAPHPHKVFIAGNHDAALAIPEKRRVILADYPDLIYLQDSGAELTLHDRTVTLYGTPRTPRTAQNRNTLTSFRTSSDIKQWMEAIPENTDILITHGPPLGHRDVAGVGCRHLLARLWHVRPLLHVFGHIHAGHGVTRATWSPIQTIYEGFYSPPPQGFIAGNHGIVLATPHTRDPILATYPDLIYLEDTSVTLTIKHRKLNLYGSPHTPLRGVPGVFRYPRGEGVWDIPACTDILITHGPPKSYLDINGHGCAQLRQALWNVRPRLHVFGHIHGGRGRSYAGWSRFQHAYERVCDARTNQVPVLQVVSGVVRDICKAVPHFP